MESEHLQLTSRDGGTLLTQQQDSSQQRQGQLKKRVENAPTMNARRWKPSEERIRKLYVDEGTSFKELCETINKEFNFSATERQFNFQIKRMRLERNVKVKEQSNVVRNVTWKEQLGKKIKLVRVRGHTIDPQKLSRWKKDFDIMNDQLAIPLSCPSPPPSCVSILTKSSMGSQPTGSVVLTQHQRHKNIFDKMEPEHKLLQRLLEYHSRGSEGTEAFQMTQNIFSDIQQVLGSDHGDWIACKNGCSSPEYDAWFDNEHPRCGPGCSTSITQLRNAMNLKSGKYSKSQVIVAASQHIHGMVLRGEDRAFQIPFGTCRHSSWLTPYGLIQATFYRPSFSYDSQTTGKNTGGQPLSGRFMIVPGRTNLFQSCIIFDFSSESALPGLSASLTYCPMVSNNSEVFRVIRDGQLKDLITLLDSRRASLHDRDEQGRSLLNYAIVHLRDEFCEYLVEHDADVNAIEMDRFGDMAPVHTLYPVNFPEVNENVLATMQSQAKLMLEAGADSPAFRLFILLVSSVSVLRTFLDCWMPVLDINAYFLERGRPPLLEIADDSGYGGSECFQIVEKAMLLLESGANIDCRGSHDSTVLHSVLECYRFHEDVSKDRLYKSHSLWRWKRSLSAPREMLSLFISAGADVFAMDGYGETPYDVATECGRLAEWEQALEDCGYDLDSVEAHRHQDRKSCTVEHSVSRLSFEDCCQRLRARGLPPEGCYYNDLWKDVEVDEPEDNLSDTETDEASDTSESAEENHICSNCGAKTELVDFSDLALAGTDDRQYHNIEEITEYESETRQNAHEAQVPSTGEDVEPWDAFIEQNDTHLDQMAVDAIEVGDWSIDFDIDASGGEGRLFQDITMSDVFDFDEYFGRND